jgi:protein gp37
MRWKRTKQFVTVVGIFGASKWTKPRLAFVAQTAEWFSRLLSNTAIPSVYLGRVILTPKHLHSQFTKTSLFFRELEPAVILTASIPNTSKSLSLLVK